MLLEVRNGSFKEAEELVTDSLLIHFATGRLWATLIQLQHARAVNSADYDRVYETFNRSLMEIPKSGEVWCEGARLAMANVKANKHRNYEDAENHLKFAIQFTP